MSLNTVTLEFDNKLRTLRSTNCTSPTNETPNMKPLENKPLCLGENIPYADESPERPIIPTRSKPLRNFQRNEMLSSSSTTTTTSSSTPPNSPAEFLLSPRTLRHHDIDETLIRSSQSPSKLSVKSSSQLSQTQIIHSPSQTLIQPKPPVTPTGASSDETDASTTSNPRDNSPTPNISNTNAQTSSSSSSNTTQSSSMRINTEVLREILTDLENKDRMKSIKTKLNRSLSLNYKNHRDDCCCNVTQHQHNRQASNTSTTSTSNRFSLTKDEKTDKNISKKRQLQDMRNHRHRHTSTGNRSIKRRHTVGGTHDYVNKSGNSTGNGVGGGDGGGSSCRYITSDMSSPEWLSRKREMKASHLEQENCRY